VQTVSEAPGAVEGYQQTGHHRQRRWQPYGNFAVAKQLVKCPDNHVVDRRLLVDGMSQGCQNSCPRRQPSDMHGEELVVPEETMGGNVNAGNEVESGQGPRRNEAPHAAGPHHLV